MRLLPVLALVPAMICHAESSEAFYIRVDTLCYHWTNHTGHQYMTTVASDFSCSPYSNTCTEKYVAPRDVWLSVASLVTNPWNAVSADSEQALEQMGYRTIKTLSVQHGAGKGDLCHTGAVPNMTRKLTYANIDSQSPTAPGVHKVRVTYIDDLSLGDFIATTAVGGAPREDVRYTSPQR
ncbi:hypothetical protein DVF89_22490 [Salmonella enterica subsp. enterica]|nr:hypothetical protein [Salmonella enterica subsp. enterica serovar Kinondoni]